MVIALDEIAALEQQWIGRIQVSEPGTYFDWQPAPVETFIALLAACLSYVPAGNRTFLDVGCGIGTKSLLAAAAGLEAYGLDRVPAYVAEAVRAGVIAWEGLAGDYDGYPRYGCVYVNHPLKDPAAEADLERLIHGAMAPGAVLLDVNYDLAPGCTSHPPDRVCDANCVTSVYSGWTEIVRVSAWSAAWVKS